ncbi:hypothetical protein COT63_00590 [Candidatus Shapirobacteria bacterium CG09_land_8_20_14_0_10_38_17]|uniref:Peptidase C39-like domain-containing protein n=1 Tax=Candidatus Shapirobacteria bacterium CG09_land_8_20_14_0_10_38_17 TaxID=1974884 RepID=A0A2H0WRP4_9BACT|nr:MAG: hypothetical protein COT63_00590 [Candidatus Shapirobacteria bacterium CG09_land_8_20_14_0_10_38_17]
MKKKIWVLLLSFLVLAVLVISPLSVGADEASDLEDKIADLQQKISETQEKKRTLSSQIELTNQKIYLIQLQISQTKNQISTLEEEIEDLSGKIEKLDISLDKVSQILLQRIVETYKKGQLEPSLFLFSADNAGQFLRNYKYIQEVQKHDKMLMLALEEAKQNFDTQKSLKEEKQEKLEELKKQLGEQNTALDLQRKEKEYLLEVTKNDEVRYQQLLAEAQRELSKLLSFTTKRVGVFGSYCAGEFSSGETGWFFSQRDSRWCSSLIGNSDMTIGKVGCLICSTAMVNKSRGVDITPLGVANNPFFFVPGTAYMLWPFPSFVSQHFTGILKSEIDSQLGESNPVIVHLNLGGDGHWIVLIKKDGNDYLINDPWEGPDKRLNDYYSWAVIDRAYTLK